MKEEENSVTHDFTYQPNAYHEDSCALNEKRWKCSKCGIEEGGEPHFKVPTPEWRENSYLYECSICHQDTSKEKPCRYCHTTPCQIEYKHDTSKTKLPQWEEEFEGLPYN